MELWWLLPGGFVAFFVFAYIKGLIYAKKTYGKYPSPTSTSPRKTSDEMRGAEELEEATRTQMLGDLHTIKEALGKDYHVVLNDFSNALIKVYDNKEQYPLYKYPIELLPHDKSRIAEILDYLIMHGDPYKREDELMGSKMLLERFTDDEELLKKQQEAVDTLKRDEQR